jgi:hypothetical protein
MQIAAILSFLKCAVAGAGAASLITAAILVVRSRRFFHSFLTSGSLALLSAFVLTRGAPHNNPKLFAAYDAYGTVVLLIILVVIILIGVLGAWLLRTHTLVPSPKMQWLIVAILTALAALAAAEPVAQLWNVAQWGDSIFYDRIAISIARGAMPAGHSYYMPIFQYGPALLYWAFGHFNFIQQVANVLLALLTVPLLAFAAWNFFRNAAAVLLVSLLAATIDTLRSSPFILQIENWYVPILCFSIWAASNYFRQKSIRSAIVLGIAAGLIFETRTQAGFYVGWLSLAPLWLRAAPIKTKLQHFILLVLVVIAMATPWTLRNLAVSGRISPTGTQAGQHIIFSNNEGNFFGIRRDLTTPTVAQPISASDRLLKMAREPLYVLRAAWWRSLAFYGLLPPGIWEKSGPRSTQWSEIPGYLLRIAPTLALLLASALAVLLRPGRLTFFLLGSIGANVALVFFVGFSEPRLSYPIVALHIMLAAAAIFPPRIEFIANPETPARVQLAIPRMLPLVASVIVTLFALSHLLIGRQFLYAPQTDAELLLRGGVKIDQNLPDLNLVVPNPPWVTAPIRSGMRARFTGVVTNSMEPVKWYAFPMPGFPDYTADPRREAYFRSYLLDKAGTFEWGVSQHFSMTLAGATIDRPLREDEGIEVEGQVLDVMERGTFWFRAEKIRHLDGAPGTFERFPKD